MYVYICHPRLSVPAIESCRRRCLVVGVLIDCLLCVLVAFASVEQRLAPDMSIEAVRVNSSMRHDASTVATTVIGTLSEISCSDSASIAMLRRPCRVVRAELHRCRRRDANPNPNPSREQRRTCRMYRDMSQQSTWLKESPIHTMSSTVLSRVT